MVLSTIHSQFYNLSIFKEKICFFLLLFKFSSSLAKTSRFKLLFCQSISDNIYIVIIDVTC